MEGWDGVYVEGWSGRKIIHGGGCVQANGRLIAVRVYFPGHSPNKTASMLVDLAEETQQHAAELSEGSLGTAACS